MLATVALAMIQLYGDSIQHYISTGSVRKCEPQSYWR